MTIIYNHIGAVICALNTLYQTENGTINHNDLIDDIKSSTELYQNEFNMKQLFVDKKAIEEILFCQEKYSQNGYYIDAVINSESEEEKSVILVANIHTYLYEYLPR